MNIHHQLRELINANAPYWAAEAEVVRTYWNSPLRSKETDRAWLLRQMYKEIWDGVYPCLKSIERGFDQLEKSISRDEMLDYTKVLQDEFIHYCRFAEIYALLDEDNARSPGPEYIQRHGNWRENQALMAIRAQHRAQYGVLGTRAQMFTEGGYCTLYSEGMKLQGRGGVDDLIAAACSVVYEDEFEHMLMGIVGIDADTLPDQDWTLLTRLTVEQLQHRILMRNAQFSFTVPEERLRVIHGGGCAPLAFDYARASGHA